MYYPHLFHLCSIRPIRFRITARIETTTHSRLLTCRYTLQHTSTSSRIHFLGLPEAPETVSIAVQLGTCNFHHESPPSSTQIIRQVCICSHKDVGGNVVISCLTPVIRPPATLLVPVQLSSLLGPLLRR